LEYISREVIRRLWGCLCELYILMIKRGIGGILLMWDSRVGEKIEDCVGIFSVACSFRSVIDNFE
jgi:hypothetical protein